MPSEVLAIAEAVVARLNGGDYAEPIEAELQLEPLLVLGEIGTRLAVFVMPKQSVGAPLDRRRWSNDHQITVTVQKRMQLDDSDPVDKMGDQHDAMEELREQLLDRLHVLGARPLGDYQGATLTAIAHSPSEVEPGGTDSLADMLLYTGKLDLAFRTQR
jgi:hypothetical protein